jgi:purine-binding chemotaxis protein CheW
VERLTENISQTISFLQKRRHIMMEQTIMDQAVRVINNKKGKYLTFSLAGEKYGLEILKVKEIIGIMPITIVPQTSPYIRGVINLRGKVIPVIDLRLKFSIAAAECTERTCIIVVEILVAGRMILMGILVDSVSEVLNIKAADRYRRNAFLRHQAQSRIYSGDG